MAKLYELTDAYVALMAQYEDAETDAERAEIIAALQEVESNIATKGENYARIIKNKTADSEMLAKEIKRLQEKKKAADNAVESLKNNLLFAMGIAGATEINTSIGKWRIQQNPPKVVITNPALVPARFLKEVEPEFDKKAIMAEYKESGELYEGIEIVREDSVRFR